MFRTVFVSGFYKSGSKHTNPASDHTKAAVELQILQELAVYRSWPAAERPDWLAFEVIAQLQIRPVQYTVAKSLIEGIEKQQYGPITQLNMGEGKTRVILPMLAMYWKNSSNLVRFNFLSALLQEAGEYLHKTVTATVINIPIFHFPFNRDVGLEAGNVKMFYSALKHCQQVGGVIICAPEHRQSLKLKWFEKKGNVNKFDYSRTIELNGGSLDRSSSQGRENEAKEHDAESNENESEDDLEDTDSELDDLPSDGNQVICRYLDRINSMKYVDVLDEVDEILRTKNKLIYAVGQQTKLPSKESRLNVMQALLGTISSSEKVRRLLSDPTLVQGEVGSDMGSFKEFRIIRGETFTGLERRFIQILLEELIGKPPIELEWMKKLRLSKQAVVDYVTKPEVKFSAWSEIDSNCHDDILALRGFLASGLLVHCLMRRNRVDYGVRRSGGKQRLMAVPFRACETPSLRAEFGHPDCALMYTCLCYYYDGLNSEQVFEAFSHLLHSDFGESTKTKYYEDWFKVFKDNPCQMPPEHRERLDDVAKLDLTNTILMSLLNWYFSKNRKTINFWLNHCVFPIETKQFPYRLEATAWDIANNSVNQVSGFSGTNDDRLIMPSSLKWVEQREDLSLIGTDGKMLHLLLKSHLECIEISSRTPQWEQVIEAVVSRVANDDGSRRTCALIDAGALMAGASDNEKVATRLADKLDKGIIYFDIPKNGWWVRDKHGRAWPKHASPIHERDGFVYFDESRTRGADMKLNINSCAVLTLGPQMCKDKLMQAAGRMRMLEHGQLIHLLATQDVVSRIRSSNNLDDATPLAPVHVLKWVMSNSVDNVAKWLPEWAIQGGNFFLKKTLPDCAQIPDKTSLEDMYNHELQERPVCEVWKEKLTNLKRKLPLNLFERRRKVPRLVQNRTDKTSKVSLSLKQKSNCSVSLDHKLTKVNSRTNLKRKLPQNPFGRRRKAPRLIRNRTTKTSKVSLSLKQKSNCSVSLDHKLMKVNSRTNLKRKLPQNLFERRRKVAQLIRNRTTKTSKVSLKSLKQKGNCSVSLDHKLMEINSRIEEYGKEYKTKLGSSMEEECERELEKEMDVEEEIQSEISSRSPIPEDIWDVKILLACSSPLQMNKFVKITELKNFIDNNIFVERKPVNQHQTSIFNWPPSVYGTDNFFKTVENPSPNLIFSMNDYLRHVDFFLVFDNGDVVLISEREADNIQMLTWTEECRTFVMRSLTYTRKQPAGESVTFQSPPYTPWGRFQVSEGTMAALSLFQGLVMFPSNEEKAAVAEILSTDSAKQEAALFCEMRGLDFTYQMSDLQKLCRQYHVR